MKNGKKKYSDYVPVNYVKDPSAIPFAIGSRVKTKFDGIGTVVDGELREPFWPAGPCLPVAWVQVDSERIGKATLVFLVSTLEAVDSAK